jgi:O-antigen/teichoic acid export membrane protein
MSASTKTDRPLEWTPASTEATADLGSAPELDPAILIRTAAAVETPQYPPPAALKRMPAVPAPARAASFMTDLGSSLLTQALVVAGNLVTLRLAAHLMTPDAVGELALGRRVLIFLSPPLLLGLSVGLPRTLGSQHSEPRLMHATAIAGWTSGLFTAFVASAIIVAKPAALAQILFGSAQHADLVLPLVAMIIGQQAFMLTFAVFRGRLQVRRGNALQILHAALIPVAAVLLIGRGGQATSALWMIGAGTCLLALLSAVVLFRSIRWDFTRSEIRASFDILMRYGLPRVPGDLANAGLYALGPLLAAHSLDMHAAGMLAIGLQFVTVLAAAFTPLGLVLLPRLSRTLARHGDERVREILPMAIAVVSYASVFMVLLGAAFGNTWLTWVLSPAYRIHPVGLALLAVAAGANVVVVVLRSWNDAAHFRPVNAVIAAIALAAQVVFWIVLKAALPGNRFVAICAALSASFVLQAFLTLGAIGRRFGLGTSPGRWVRWVAVQLAIGSFIVLLAHLTGSRGPIAGLVAQVAACAAWVLTLRIFGEHCFVDLWRRVRPSRRASQTAASGIQPAAGPDVQESCA